jgi:hypothetical protein
MEDDKSDLLDSQSDNNNSISESQEKESNKEQKSLNNDDDNNNIQITEEDLNSFNTKLHSIQKGINTLKSKFSSLIGNMQSEDYELQYGLSFFESKQDMMNMYITNLLKYCYLKICANQPISGNPLLKENIKISSLIERVKVIEMKLQHLINKTININNKDKNNIESVNEMDFKPKILSIYNNKDNDDNRGDNESDNSDEENEIKEKKNKNKLKTYMEKSELYKLKNKDVDFYETKAEQKNRKRQIERGKEKIRNSEMMRSLREEMSDKPTNYDNNSNSYLNKYMKQVEKYEKDHFVNITVPKKLIKQLKRKDNNVEDLYKIDSDLKILSNTLNEDGYSKNKNKNKNKIGDSDKKNKKFLNKKRKHK